MYYAYRIFEFDALKDVELFILFKHYSLNAVLTNLYLRLYVAKHNL